VTGRPAETMMILVLTEQFDPTADRVIDILNDRGVPVFRTDTAEFPQRLALTASLTGNGRWTGPLATAHRDVDLADIGSVWYRRPTTFDLPAGLSEPEARVAAAEARLGLCGCWAHWPRCGSTHPGAEADAAYKPAQLAVAARCGLTVPATLVTNDPDAVRLFAKRLGLTATSAAQHVWFGDPDSALRWPADRLTG